MFQKKIEKLLHGIPDICSIADDILIPCFDEQGRDDAVMLDKVLRICRTNLKLNRDKCLFRCTSIAFFGEK